MEVHHLREFCHLAKTMNFTATAANLNLSQSALSTHIMKMERELRCKLIDRSHQQIELTLAGSEFLKTASSMLEEYDSFEKRAKASNGFALKHITVQTLAHVDAAELQLLKAIRRFQEQDPEVVVDIKESLENDVVRNIQKGLVDCGHLGMFNKPPELPNGVSAIPLFDEELVIWVDRQSEYIRNDTLRPEDLSHASLPVWSGISNDLESMYRDFFGSRDIDIHLKTRHCTSREDFFLNRIEKDDIVLLTKGNDNINAIRVRDDRVSIPFNPPVFETSYLAFSELSFNEALEEFRAFIEKMRNESDS